ncbi:YihY/virulence factor BrkB family protein [Pseudaminobacter soli (ex Li et al. 2025)]|uniref:YihY/virulence factor BrkB family protein n=1 Tax=Pseudaminobacter soli (ex Li et al. 2025) TaxID=1295366 RepID=UPI001FE01945|nr:YihY/virulence factor BrkB family protein [Mesorhizobium soli]
MLALLLLGFQLARPSAQRGDRATLNSAGESRAGLAGTSPAPGWIDVLRRAGRDVSRHRVLANAAGVAFYAILAIFPALAALVAIYGLFADPRTIGNQLALVAGVFPQGAIDVMTDQLTRVASQGNSALGFAFAVGVLVSLWSANAGVKALFDALNVVYGQQEKRSILRFNAISLVFTFGAICVVLLALFAVAVVPLILAFVGLSGVADALLRIARWPLLLVVIAFGLTLLYRYGPSRGDGHVRSLTWGSGFAAVAWLAVSMVFSWYAANFGHYNQTYGSLGAIIGFMVWIWLSATVILIGGELDAAFESHLRKDKS